MIASKRSFRLLLLPIACLCCHGVFAQGKWTLLKDKDSIRISSRTSAGSGFNDVRVEMDLTGHIADVVSAVLNVGDYQNWAYATRNSVPVRKTSDSSLIYYSEIVAPWPVSNRDLYANISVHKDSLGKKAFIECTGMPGFAASREHLVRIPFSKGSWELTELTPGRVHLDYILQINPGGSLPAWVVNMFIARGPYETFSHLRTMMKAKI